MFNSPEARGAVSRSPVISSTELDTGSAGHCLSLLHDTPALNSDGTLYSLEEQGHTLYPALYISESFIPSIRFIYLSPLKKQLLGTCYPMCSGLKYRDNSERVLPMSIQPRNGGRHIIDISVQCTQEGCFSRGHEADERAIKPAWVAQ